jgi:hypothetical protein
MISQLNIMRGTTTKVSQGKLVIYRFNGDPRYDERVSDTTGSLPFHSVGEIVFKNGKRWRIMIVRVELDLTASRKAVPMHHVFVNDKF